MRKFLLISFVALYSSICYSQTSESTYAKLLEFYSEEYLAEMKTNSPQGYDYLLTFVDRGYIIEKSEKSNAEFTNITSLHRQAKGKPERRVSSETFNEKNFNILFFDVAAIEDRQYFAFGNTGAILVILSRKELLEKINQK